MKKFYWIMLLFLPSSLTLHPSAWAAESLDTLLSTTTSQADLGLVDPEFSQTPIPKLVLPPEPPANVHLSEIIVKSGEWKGSQCGVQEPRFAVFRHADKWDDFWKKALAPYSPRLAKTPAVDFDKDMVVGVFMGEKPYPHYQIEIRSIEMESIMPRLNSYMPKSAMIDRVLVVRYKEVKRMMGVFVPPFAVQPFHMKKVPTFAGQVVFLKVKR